MYNRTMTVSEFLALEVFPTGTRPSSRGSFLFRGSRPLPREEFERTLDKLESILTVRKGPFFLGSSISGVDCAFAPFLERWYVP